VNYIKRLNVMHEGFLRDNKVDYYNKYARFLGPNAIELIDHDG